MREKEFYDESYIKIRSEFEQAEDDLRKFDEQKPNDIKNGYIHIDGDIIEFAEKDVAGKISVNMPKDFNIMPPAMVAVKYPQAENKDKFIYTGDDSTINLIFDFKQRKMFDNAGDRTAAGIQKLRPSVSILDKGDIQFEGGRAEWFDFITPALDADIYNFMFFFELDGNLVIGTFNCLKNEMHNWAETARQITAGIKIS